MCVEEEIVLVLLTLLFLNFGLHFVIVGYLKELLKLVVIIVAVILQIE